MLPHRAGSTIEEQGTSEGHGRSRPPSVNVAGGVLADRAVAAVVRPARAMRHGPRATGHAPRATHHAPRATGHVQTAHGDRPESRRDEVVMEMNANHVAQRLLMKVLLPFCSPVRECARHTRAVGFGDSFAPRMLVFWYVGPPIEAPFAAHPSANEPRRPARPDDGVSASATMGAGRPNGSWRNRRG
jgi:hypothetical protein